MAAEDDVCSTDDWTDDDGGWTDDYTEPEYIEPRVPIYQPVSRIDKVVSANDVAHELLMDFFASRFHDSHHKNFCDEKSFWVKLSDPGVNFVRAASNAKNILSCKIYS